MNGTKSAGKGNRKAVAVISVIIGLLCIVAAVCIILPPSSGKPKPFLDEDGNVWKGSLAEKTFVDINGVPLGMFIMAKDQSNPVLLLLGGGPGIPEYFLEQVYPTGLADAFVVCYLEYRGTSLSYHSGIDLAYEIKKQGLPATVAFMSHHSEVARCRQGERCVARAAGLYFNARGGDG